MKIDRETIRHLEKLARIELTDDEAEKLTGQLDRIVAFVEKLQTVDTEGVAPTRLMSHGGEAPGGGTPLRTDQVRPGLERDRVLDQAPDASGPFFRVPRVIGKGDE